MFSLEYDKKCLKQLRKIDRFAAEKIIDWLENYIDKCDNPRLFGKALTGDFGDLWRYRIGNYRVIAKIEDSKCIVNTIKIGHRKDIYK